jgi:stress response protein YsnF
MSRTVAALYQSRAEAEFARARLISDVRAQSPRIIGKETAAAIDGLGLNPKDAESYRQGLNQGGHLLVAKVPSGTAPTKVVELLKAAKGKSDDGPEVRIPDGEGVRVELPGHERAKATPQASAATAPPAPASEPKRMQLPSSPAKAAGPGSTTPSVPAASQSDARGTAPSAEVAYEGPAVRSDTEEEHIPIVAEEMRIDKREVPRGGARVRAFTREAPVEEQVELKDESVEVETRTSGVPLNGKEIESGGLFTERVFEFAEMREEAVVTKEAFVREEVIIRKRVNARTETVRDTVRHTEVEVEELAPRADGTSAFFSRSHDEPRP